MDWLHGGLALVTSLVALAGWRDAPSRLEAARQLDRHLGTGDRIAAAVDFSAREAPSLWMLAAIADAERHMNMKMARSAAALHMPLHGRHAMGSLFAWIITAALLFPVNEVEASALSQVEIPKRFGLSVVALDPQAQEELLAEQTNETTRPNMELDPAVKDATEELNELIRGLRSDTVRLETAHQRLAGLEARLKEFNERSGEDSAQELERAKRAGKSPRKTGREISPLLEAIRKAKWREAAQALESLAKRSPKDRKRLSRDLSRLAKRLESERARRARSLKKERRRLQKKQSSGTPNRRARRRLRKNQRSLERLERETARAGETGRQLERLERELQSAAQDLLRRSQGEPLSQESLKRAADLLRRLQKAEQSRAQMRRLSARSEAIRELLRRAAQRGKKGKDGKKGDGRTRFMRLARGDGAKPGGQGSKGGKKSKNQTVMLTRSGTSRVTVMSQSSSGGAAGSDPSRPGDDAAGQGHDSNLFGDKERLHGRSRNVNVTGDEGEGPSSRQVVSAAAQRGFATRGWKQVHQDYRGVVEERMERQSIPAGHRRYVRRYFDLIRPR